MASEMDMVLQNLESVDIGGRRTERDVSNYENIRRLGNQNERRTDLLETQRYSNPRNKSQPNKSRHILDMIEAMGKEMPRTASADKSSCYLQGLDKVVNYFNVVSDAEWMLEKPEDFAESWLMAACPKGRHMLVIAYKGTTKFFSKFGTLMKEASTALPGGNYSDLISNSKSCVLDGFYCKRSKIMFVIDILAFNNHMMSYAEAGARHEFLEDKIKTITELTKLTEKNEVIFQVIPKKPCTIEAINEFLSVFPYFERNQPPVDGLLFYHSRAMYFSGETPLVGWLYPYMLPEFLGVDLNVHKVYQLEKPAVGYVNYIKFIEDFEARPKRQRQRRFFSSYAVNEVKKYYTAVATAPINTEMDIVESQRLDVAAGPWPFDNNGAIQGQDEDYLLGLDPFGASQP